MLNDFPTRLFDLYYGQSGSGKSEALRELIEYILAANPGKIARVVIGDGSLLTYEHLIERGLVQAVEFSYRPYPLDVIQRLCEGWWPKDNDPNGPLVAPKDQPDINNVLIYAFEGASVAGTYIMGSATGGLSQLSAAGVKIGQDSPIMVFQGTKDEKGKLVDGPGTTFGGNPPAHYNVAQRAIVDGVQRSRGLAPYVIWTAHEAANDPEKDKVVKEPIMGPEVAGKALTASFQRIFNNTLHFQSVAKRGREKDEFTGRDTQDLLLDYRIWTQDHFSPDNNTTVRYKAVTRGVRGMNEFYRSIIEYYQERYRKQRAGGLTNTPASV